MKFGARRAAVAALSVAATAACLAPGASAHDPLHDTHEGWYIESPTSISSNMHLLAESPRTRPEPTYRNSDLAFWGRKVYAGNYDGFRILDASDPEDPKTLVDFDCPGSQHDVSVWGDLLFLSIDGARTGPDCNSVPAPAGTVGWEGIRIFDVSDPSQPRFVTGVPTDCGSHTHTLVPDTENGRVLLYVSSYPASNLGTSPYGNSCRRLTADGGQGHEKISVVEVPLDEPETASVAAEPRIGQVDFRNTPGFRGCHDITVFTAIDRAAAACLGEGQIWDISDRLEPKVLARVHNDNVDIWHSATFSWDATTVVFGDEAGGGTSARCRDSDPSTVGAVWFYDVASLDNQDGSTDEPWLGHFKIPRPQGEANCTMHNFNPLPLAGRDVLVSAAYSGGTTAVDFSDAANPREVGHYDPHGANTWSSYWYNGLIYTNDSGRGVDVVRLSDPARAGARKLPYLNPQTQEDLIR